MKTEHMIGVIIILLLAIDVYLQYKLVQQNTLSFRRF